MAGDIGFEPMRVGIKIRCLDQLGESPTKLSGGDVGPGGTWIFDGEGIIQLPNSGTIGNDGNNIDKMWGLGTPEDLKHYLENYKK